jgi:hypothetical protein
MITTVLVGVAAVLTIITLVRAPSMLAVAALLVEIALLVPVLHM